MNHWETSNRAGRQRERMRHRQEANVKANTDKKNQFPVDL